MKFKDLDKEVKEILGEEIEDDEHDKEQVLMSDQKKDIINEEDDDDLFGGILDNVPDDSTTSSASNVSPTIIRDMLPKKFTGRLPKVQLEEFCRKKDDKAKISFGEERSGSLY